MTEGGHATFTMDPDGARTRPGAVGRPTPPVEVRIVDDQEMVLPTGEIGEVITRNPAGHREYYRNAEATARMWDGGWLHTGDLGYLDADGYLYIVGRRKEMVVRGGMNVYADDVEAVLQAHPAVVEAAVIGIPHEVLGEDIAAYVVLRPGTTVSTAELQAFAGERLADYKVPRRVHCMLLGGGRSAIVAAAAQTPLAIVLEDIHWADNSTLMALRSLATARPEVAVRWVLTGRTGAGGPAIRVTVLERTVIVRLCR